MTLPAGLLSAMMGGTDLTTALGSMLRFPCARCLADGHDADTAAPAVTLAGGSLMCERHACDQLDRDDQLGLLIESLNHDREAAAVVERTPTIQCDDTSPHAAHKWSTIRTPRRTNAYCLGVSA